MMKNMTRRSFIASGAVALGGCTLPSAFLGEKTPRLRFGVVSDVHIGGRKESPERLKFALNWLARQNVDAVLFPGDIAHSGRVRQIEQFAEIWFGVFPGGRAADGHKVEFMMSTGNHEAWEMGLGKASEADRRANWLFYADNAARTWQRVLGEKWELVWRKEVKGYTFIGSQWPTFKPDLRGFWKAHAAEFDPTKPIFYCQHQGPRGTCAGSAGTDKSDPAAEVFAHCPNVVAISGHSHQTIADPHIVWQGGFTSIGAGCLHEGGGSFAYENGGAFWYPKSRKNLMTPLNDPDRWGGDPEGGCFEMIDVYDDSLRIVRRSSVYDLPIGPDLIVPLPAREGSPFSVAAVNRPRPAPQFAEGARVVVRYCPKGHELENVAFRKLPCVEVSFPGAHQVAEGNRVYDYEVKATAANGRVRVHRIQAPGFSSPLARCEKPATCLFLPTELPAAEGVTFEVTARDACGNRSAAIAATPFSLLAAAGGPKDGRKLVWQDDFDGTKLDPKKWTSWRSMYSGDCLYANDARTVEVKDSLLTMHALPSPDPAKRCLLPEGISTLGTMAFKYGYLEMRAKVPFKHGAWPSFWMQSTPKLRTCKWMSEVDIFEVFSNADTVVSNLHKWQWNDKTKKSEHVMLPGGEGSNRSTRSYRFGHPETLNDEFHVYGFEWTPTEMAFYVDGLKYTSYPIDARHDYAPQNKFLAGMAGYQDYHGIILNNEVFTPGHGFCPPKAELKADDLPITYQVDWMRLWQKEGETFQNVKK